MQHESTVCRIVHGERIETEVECHCWHPQLRANLAALNLWLIRARGLLTFGHGLGECLPFRSIGRI